jgi:hypothetical protein
LRGGRAQNRGNAETAAQKENQPDRRMAPKQQARWPLCQAKRIRAHEGLPSKSGLQPPSGTNNSSSRMHAGLDANVLLAGISKLQGIADHL